MKTHALLMVLGVLALGGCYADEPLPSGPKTPTKTVLTGDLDTDIREKTHVELTITGNDVEASITLMSGYGVAPTTALTGAGHVESFREADMVMYTARFAAPGDPSGPCGADPVSLALAVRRRAKDAHVGGALTAYCGKDVWHGVPARVLRLAGDLPLNP
jgi:hypothetical protein